MGLFTGILTCLVAVVILCHPLEAGSDRKPNILFIFLDDFGWRDTGFMGSDFYETPHLDRLAGEGMVFSDAYSCAANCAPARASLLSGQYSPRHKIYNVGTTPRGKKEFRRLEHIPGVRTLDPGISTWAHQIQKQGYVTATMGKWHLSKDPIPYGFDVNIGGDTRGGPPKGYYPPFPDAPGLENPEKGKYLTDLLSEKAVDFIEENHEKPWLLYLTHFAVHTPLHAKRELVSKYQDKKKGELHNHVEMATMIQSVDDGVGMIMEKIKSLGLDDNTITLFFSDNGGYGPATDMHPLKGYKGTYYEGGIRVPFFVRWPGIVEAGAQSDTPIIGVDIYPTLCEITGAKLPEGQAVDGRSLVPLFLGKSEGWEQRALYWHFPAYLQSYQVTHEQRDPLFRSRPCSIIRVGDYKLHHYYEDSGIELYNLREDIGETKNLAGELPGRALELAAMLNTWRKAVGADIPTKANPDFNAELEAAAIARGKK